jgi:EmrB/QacA subfamily drug resistance transporter
VHPASTDALPRPNANLTFAVLGLAGMAFSLLQSLVAPALTTIEHDLGASSTAGAWILTAYLLSASVATPIAGRIGDMFGKKRTLVVVLLVLALGTVVSALATSIGVMIAGRVIQGVGGAVFPLAFSIVRDEFPPRKVPVAIALMSALLGIGGGLGIVLAGPIVESLNYHWLFWLPLVVVVLSAIGTLLWIPESPITSPGRINWLGAGLLAGWLVALLVAVSQGASWGWGSPRVLGLFAAAVALFATWIVAEGRSNQPLVDMRMMRIRGVWATNLAALLIGFGMYGAFLLVPSLVQQPESTGYGFGATVTEAGLFLAPMPIAMLLVSPVAGRLGRSVGPRVPLIAGSLVCAVAFVVLTGAHGERWEIYAATALLGVGIGLAFASLANLIVEAVRPEQTGVATGMNTIMRSIGGAVGGQVAAAVVTASAVAGGLPQESGYTTAFAISIVGLVLAVGASLLVPSRRASAASSTTQPVAEPAPA